MNRKNVSSNLMLRGMMIGTLTCIAATLLLVAIAATLIEAETISVSAIDYCVPVILLLSAMIGSMVGVRKANQKALYVSLLVGVIYMMLLLSITALFYEGQYHGLGVTALVVASGSLISALMGRKGEGRSKKRRSKIRHR